MKAQRQATVGQRTKASISTRSNPSMMSRELRELRRNDLHLSQKDFAPLVGSTENNINQIERRNRRVPGPIASAALALRRAKQARQIELLVSPRLRPWRESKVFRQKPPFESLPANGTACGCGSDKCRLCPFRDGDWPLGHLWGFHGSRCYRHVYLNSAGVKVRPVRKRLWPESMAFKQKPPFSDVPSPCPMCASRECKPKPVRDTERDGEHQWVFQGAACYKSYCLNAQGKYVGTPRSLIVSRRTGDGVPKRQCSRCGRRQAVGKKYSVRLKCDFWTRYCRRKKGDAKDQQHDPPVKFIERNGRFEEIAEEVIERLHGRSRRLFSVPKCELAGCPRLGKTMERSAVLQLRDANGNTWRIATYRCRPLKSARPHAAYRVLPNGEEADRMGLGRYRWTGTTTGVQHETVMGKRPIRKNRVMPPTECPEHHCQVIRVSGPWPIRVKDERGKRLRGERLSSRTQCWRARCPVGNEYVYVGSHGISKSPRHSRWHKPKHGPVPTKRPLFEQALNLKQSGLSWGQIAKKLDPTEFAKDQRRTTDRVRVGAQKLRHKAQLAKSASA